MKPSMVFSRAGLIAVLALAAPLALSAQDYGPPAGIPSGYGPSGSDIQKMMQDAQSQAPSGAPNMPSGQAGPQGMPSNIPNPEEMMKKGAAQQLQGLKAGMRGMEQGVKQFDNMLKQVQKAGGDLSAEVKTKYQSLKQNIAKVKNAKSADEIEDIDTDGLQGEMQDLMEEAQTAMQNTMQLQGLKRAMAGMENGLKAFEAQLARIAKQKVNIPSEIKDKVAKIKTAMAAVKAAKTWDQAEAAGVEELQDDMESLNDYRDQLEVLMRLPMMQKALDQQVNNLNKALKQAQGLVAKMQKQGIDLAEEYNEFNNAIKALIGVRDAAMAKIKSGNAEEIKAALDDLEENFFGQIGDAMEHSRVIQTMAGLARFPAELKKNLAAAQNQINQLKRKKVNTAELEALLNQAKQKGNEVTSLIKAKPLDEDAVMDGIEALEDLRTQFDDKVSELGGGAAMPWETGPQQFKPLTGVSDLSKFMPKQAN